MMMKDCDDTSFGSIDKDVGWTVLFQCGGVRGDVGVMMTCGSDCPLLFDKRSLDRSSSSIPCGERQANEKMIFFLENSLSLQEKEWGRRSARARFRRYRMMALSWPSIAI